MRGSQGLFGAEASLELDGVWDRDCVVQFHVMNVLLHDPKTRC